MRKTVITITPGATANDKPTVNYQECHVSSQHGDVIEWRLSRPGTFSVEFPGDSPFEPKHQFDNTNAVSGPPTVPARTKPYHYKVGVGNAALDPDVIVDN